MKRMNIITALMITAALTSCGKADESHTPESKPTVTTTVAEAVTTTTESPITTATTEAASKDSADNINEEEITAASDSSGNIGVDRETAVSNVKLLAGSGAKIVNVTEGTSLEGFKCWVVVVEPVTTEDGPETVTYYSGYQFCYPDNRIQPGGQQNFIYRSVRCLWSNQWSWNI